MRPGEGRRKSRYSPTATVLRAVPENPPMRFTPNNDEIASLIRNASGMISPCLAIMMFQSASGVMCTGSDTERRS